MDLKTPVIDIDWFSGATKGVNEAFAMACSDGSFKLVSKQGREEKSVADAHSGAITCLKWSYDGTALATSGEDGNIKLWARSGALRSTLIQSGKPIYYLTWSPASDMILYCNEKNLSIMPTAPGQKQLTWKAHEGIVLCLDWNPTNNLIISAGEDCKYRVWDSYGRQLYSSSPYDHVITSIKWSPNGDLFAVGSYEMLRLCDKTGWSYSFQKPEVGSLLKIAWN